MKTAFIGGGPGCKALIEMITSGRFRSFDAEIVAVADMNPDSVGYRCAESIGIPVYTDMTEVLSIDGLEMVFELAGDDQVLEAIYQGLRSGVRVIDHLTARVFWELEESERRFDQFINSAHSIMTIKDLKGKYLMANARAAEFFAIDQAAFVGRSSQELLPRIIADLSAESEARIMQTGVHESLKEVFSYQGQEHTWVTERFPITDFLGDIVGVCAISRDVTNEERLRKELIQSVKMATLGQLAAGVAHEINNPLTGILSFSENILVDLSLGDPLRGDMEVIIRETMRCRQIVRDLLDYSRLSKSEPQILCISDVIGRVLSLVSKQAAFHDVAFDFHCEPSLPPVRLDPNQAQQIILNLIINAQEAMDAKGHIVIEASKDDALKMVCVEITDTGCGIPEDTLTRIFEPFYSTKGAQGNGLGLPAVQRIVDAHDSTISVKSGVGEGTTIRIGFPYIEKL